MNNSQKTAEIQKLKDKQSKYEAKLQKLLLEEDKAPGARYGNEYLQNEIKVLEDLIRSLKLEIVNLQRS